MPNHLKSQGDTFWFRYQIPKDVQGHFKRSDGTIRREIWEKLGTDYKTAKSKAELRSRELKAEIHAYRTGSTEELVQMAKRASETIRRNADNNDFFIDDVIEELIDQASDRLDVKNLSQLREEAFRDLIARGADLKGYPSIMEAVARLPEAKRQLIERIVGIATSQRHELSGDIEEWLRVTVVTDEVAREYRHSLKLFTSRFKALEDIAKSSLHSFVDDLRNGRSGTGNKLSDQTISKHMSAVRGYLSYLRKRTDNEELDDRFTRVLSWITNDHLGLNTSRKRDGKATRLAWPINELRAIEAKAAKNEKDPHLSALIQLAMYSGARLSELCSLTSADIRHIENIRVMVLCEHGGKTASAQRVVPIHPKIDTLIDKLQRNRADGQLLLSANKSLSPDKVSDADRVSRTLSKRFTTLKRRVCKEYNFRDENLKTFHSIRHTVNTMLRQRRSSVASSISNDQIDYLLGWSRGSKSSMGLTTYFNDGYTTANMKEVIDLISYD